MSEGQGARPHFDAARQAQIEEAFNLVRILAVEFDVGTRAENGLEICADPDSLWNLAVSYVDDLKRYRDYHETEMPDRARRGAYLCKWIMKFRPLAVRSIPSNPSEEVRIFDLMINESFALFCSSSVMELDWEEKINDRMRVILLYSLRHRFNSEDTYILFFAQLCNLS